MLFALCTTIFWSFSTIASARSAKYLGPELANTCRLILASILLAVWLLIVGYATWGTSAWWFVASGMVALGLGDLFLYISYQRIGPRLAVLFTHCLGVPMGAFFEWVWLGNGLHLAEMGWIVVILAGVATVLIPSRDEGRHLLSGPFFWGCLFGILSAAGLATGAVMSRSGYAGTAAAGMHLPGVDASLLRNLGGTVAMLVVAPVMAFSARGKEKTPINWRAGWPWLLATAILGPALGVITYQCALAETRAGIVQAIISLVPVLVIPLAWLADGDKPTLRSVLGGLIAAGGVAGLALTR